MGTQSISSPSVTVTMQASVRNTVNTDVQTVSLQQGRASTYTFTSGTTDSEFNRLWESKARAITSGNNEDIDVYDLGTLDIGAGAGLDALGQSWAIAEICGIHITNRSTSVGSLVVGGNGTTAAWNSIFNGDDDAVTILPPNCEMALFTASDPAWAVADTSNHLLRIAASGGDVTYDITILARSA
jgi:hypothetical protein